MGQVLYPAFYNGEFALQFLAYNMKGVINILGVGSFLKAFA
jgi:hypothetical protein